MRASPTISQEERLRLFQEGLDAMEKGVSGKEALKPYYKATYTGMDSEWFFILGWLVLSAPVWLPLVILMALFGKGGLLD